MERLKDRVALVTGAGKGIGRATAECFAGEGATVVGVARTAGDLESLADAPADMSGRVVPVAGDLTDDGFVQELFGRVESELGQLDILVNNAGLAPFDPVAEGRLKDLRACLELNIVSVFHCTQQALRLMRSQGHGRIVTIGSVRARWSESGGSGFYNASKYGVYGLMETIAREVHGEEADIAVSLVNPGIVDTPLTNPGGEPRPDWLRPAVVAENVLHTVTAPPGVNVFETVVFPLCQKPW